MQIKKKNEGKGDLIPKGAIITAHYRGVLEKNG